MNDALLKRYINDESVIDIWNHHHGNAVTIIYGEGDTRHRLLIAVNKAPSYATSPIYLVDAKLTWWESEAASPELAVSAVWKLAKFALLLALLNGNPLKPQLAVNSSYPDGPLDLVWPESLLK